MSGLAASGLWVGLAPGPDEDGERGAQGAVRRLSVTEYLVLRAAAGRILRGAAGGMTAGEVARWIDGYLAYLPPRAQADVGLLLRLLERSPLLLQAGPYPGVLAAGTRFTGLAPQAQDRVLLAWQRSRLAPLRQGFAGLKSLCCLAFYQDARSFAAIGYGGPLVP